MSEGVERVPAKGKRPRNRRDIIIAAAGELFAADGYSNVSMDDIARAVNVRPSALYRHFSGKQDLLREAILRGARLRQQAVALGEPVDLDEVLDDLARSTLETRRSSVLWTMEVRNLNEETASQIRKEFRALPDTLAAKLASVRPKLTEGQAEVLAWAALDVLASIAFHEERLPPREFQRVLRDAMARVVTGDLPDSPAGPAPTTGVDRPVRREEVLRAAAQLFARRGYTAVTVDDLASAVGMAGASLYTYFPSKQQLLAALALRSVEWQEYETRQHLRVDQSPADRLSALLEAYIRFSYTEPALVTLLLTENQHLPQDLRDSLEQVHRESVMEWADLLRLLDAERDPTVARIQVLAARMVILDVLTTPSLRVMPDLVGLVRIAARRVLDF